MTLLTIKRSHSLVLLMVVAVLGLLYGARLDRPVLFINDDVALVDFALHGHMTFWDHLVLEHQHLLQSMFGYGLQPVYLSLLNTFLHLAGVSLFNARLLQLLALLGVLFLIGWMAGKNGYPVTGWLTVIYLGLSIPFFLAAVSVRPEPLIFGILLINMYGWMASQNRYVAMPCGLLTGLALGLHPCAVLVVSAVPATYVVLHREDFRRHLPQLIRWCVGALAGSALVYWKIDWANAHAYLDYMAKGHLLGLPVKAVFHDPVSILSGVLHYLAYESCHFNRWQAIVMTACLTALCWRLRRLHTISEFQRLLALTSLILIAAFAFGLAYPDVHYNIFVYPLLIWQLLMVISDIYRKDLHLDLIDHAIFASVSLLVYVSIPMNIWEMGLTAGYFIAVLYAARQERAPMAVLLSGLVLVILIFRSNTEWMVRSTAHPNLYEITCIAWPFTVLRIRNKTLEWRFHLHPKIFAPFPVLLILFFLAGNLNHSLRIIRKDVHAGIWPIESQALLERLKNTPRILAPRALYFVSYPHTFQGVDGLILAADSTGFGLPIDVLREVRSFHPDLILWPGDRIPWLADQLARHHPHLTPLVRHAWKTPEGMLYELDFPKRT
jgi:hypothetical protein